MGFLKKYFKIGDITYIPFFEFVNRGIWNGCHIWPDGDEVWYKNGKRHREDGPAIIFSNGSKKWYQNGKIHREDGPAVIYSEGRKEWWKNGICIKTTS